MSILGSGRTCLKSFRFIFRRYFVFFYLSQIFITRYYIKWSFLLQQEIESESPVPYSNWKAGHGEGNCSYIITGSINDTDDLSNGLWGSTETCYDQSPRRVCTVCEFHGRTKNWYNLRGLCSESRHDKKFTLESDRSAKPFLKGLSTSIIKWVSYLAIPT